MTLCPCINCGHPFDQELLGKHGCPNCEGYPMKDKDFELLSEQHIAHQLPDNRIQQAIDLAVKCGGIDGAHHKAWVIDQMVRILAGERYHEIVASAKAGKDGPDSYEWNCGIAP